MHFEVHHWKVFLIIVFGSELQEGEKITSAVFTQDMSLFRVAALQGRESAWDAG